MRNKALLQAFLTECIQSIEQAAMAESQQRGSMQDEQLCNWKQQSLSRRPGPIYLVQEGDLDKVLHGKLAELFMCWPRVALWPLFYGLLARTWCQVLISAGLDWHSPKVLENLELAHVDSLPVSQ